MRTDNFNEVTDYVIYQTVGMDEHVGRWTWHDMKFLAVESGPGIELFSILHKHDINYTYSYRAVKIRNLRFPMMFVYISVDAENEALMLLVVEETLCRLEDMINAFG